MEINPYAPPAADLTHDYKPDSERLREEHINVEATIKSVGFLYFLGAFIVLCFAFGAWGSLISGTGSLWMTLLITALGLLQGWIGYGLRRLRRAAQIPATVFSVLGLLAFPLGTVINLYILSQLLSKKAAFVLTPEYHQIIATTPHVKRKTSKAAWIVLLAIIGLLVVCYILSMSLD